MKLASTVASYQEAFLRLFYPSSCGSCAVSLELEEKGLCQTCSSRLERLAYPWEEAGMEEAIPFMDQTWTLYPYEGMVRDLLTKVKFSKKTWLLSNLMTQKNSLMTALASETFYDALVPMPLSGRKLLEREFNQAELIAEMLHRETQIPMKAHLLKKAHTTVPQSQLKREERQAHLLGAFGTRGRADKFEAKTFLLVDDIVTTGATALEAAKSLKNRGAKRVDLFALARSKRNS